MRFRDILHITRCWTGRRWVNFFGGMLAIGFMGLRVDRMMVGRRWVIPRRRS